MTRIAVIGNAGGGKSVLSRRLRDALQLPLYSVDQLQWRPGWELAPADEFAAAHAKIVSAPRWIVDGWGDFGAIEERFRRCDTIVLIDFPLWRHYWWALKRQFMGLFRPRCDGPAGCPMLPMTWQLLRLIRTIDVHAMPRLRLLVEAQCPLRRVVWLRTLADLRAFHREVTRNAQPA